ncbi:minor curlin subunit CsgB [alpha proteobacterium U9-1i]|nr:minor curlin subunit CsgB [alpha proteobacterium U9-1i]
MKRSIRAMIAAASLAALMAGQAHAQERRDIPAMIYAAAMSASENRSSVQQEGANNGAVIAQNGQGNTAGIRQFGRNNTGAIAQNGNNNAACLIQIGRNLDGSITQTGDYNSTGVIQTRRGATEIPAELCQVRRGNGRGVFLGVARHIVQRANR